ncbi:MAG: LacI family transcriptional regulator [Hespellia sp.]|nr:LacI family transcriptional regulator [Hespellia sp.]
MKTKISIKEIAAQADVSIATVSRVVNQKGGYSAETEQLVKRVIKESGYTPNLMAKGLRTSQNAIIGILIPDIANEYFSSLVLELQKEFFQNGYLTMVCNSDENFELEKDYLKAMVGQQVSGIVLVSGTELSLKPTGIPTVYVGRKPRGSSGNERDIVFIESDNIEGGYLATKELLDKGCKKIAFLTDILRGSSKVERFQGYCSALMEAGIEMNPSMVLKVDKIEEEKAKEVVNQALTGGIRMDGIVCATDILAIGAITALEERGVFVPEEIKVTGFDDISASRYFRVPITTVHQYNDKMAKAISEMLMCLMKGEKIVDNRKIIPVSLIQRKSSE